MANRCKVAIIAPDLAAGGMTRAYALAQALQHAGHPVTIFGARLSSGPIYPLAPAALTLVEITGRCRFVRLLKLMLALDGDVLYAIKPRLSSFGVALLKRRLSGVPVVLDIDDWEMAELDATAPKASRSTRPSTVQRLRGCVRAVRRLLNPADKFYLRRIDRLIRRADAVTVNTRLLQTLYGGIYVPHCKDTAHFDPQKYRPEDCRRRYGLADYTVLMFPGTVRPHKGLEDILAALDLLQQPDIRLVIVGGRRSGNGYLEQLSERWARWIVRLPGVPHEQMPGVLAAAHAVVVPQRNTRIARAQFPIKLTDAMAMAKPIVTTHVGDIPEIVGDCAYVVQPSSPLQLAAALRELLGDPRVAANRGRQARERVVASYSLGSVCPVVSGLVQQIGA